MRLVGANTNSRAAGAAFRHGWVCFKQPILSPVSCRSLECLLSSALALLGGVRCSRMHGPFLVPCAGCRDLGECQIPTVAVALPCWDLEGWLSPEPDWVCPTQLRQLEMQLEQEHEQKQMVLHEKQDLEGLIGTLCEQVRGQCPPRGCFVGCALP